MINLSKTLRTQKEAILELHELQGRLRDGAVKLLPPLAKMSETATFFNMQWVTADRFFTQKRAACSRAVLDKLVAKMGSGGRLLADKIIEVSGRAEDYQKRLASYEPRIIDLAFDVISVFRDTVGWRLNMKQFSKFFSARHSQVYEIVKRSADDLEDLTVEDEAAIRKVMAETDWSTIQPLSKTQGKKEQVRRLKSAIAKLRKQYPTENAMCTALGVYQSSLDNALEGRGMPGVLAKTLSRAERLARKHMSKVKGQSQSPPSELAVAVQQLRGQMTKEAMLTALRVDYRTLDKCLAGKGTPQRAETLLRVGKELLSSLEAGRPEVAAVPAVSPKVSDGRGLEKGQGQVISSCISMFHSAVDILGCDGIRPEMFTDGHRMSVLRVIRTLLATSGIDEATIERLKQTSAITEADANLLLVVSSIGKQRRKQS